MVDVITTLMMVILLCLMFFVLNFLINRDAKEYPDSNGGRGYDYNDHDGDNDPTATPTPTSTPTPTPWDDNGGGGGGGGDGIDDPGIYEQYGEGEGHDRSAVYAVVIDEETGKAIEIEGITFELFITKGSKQILTTHYPVPVTYEEFQTTAGGWFYLPEKIRYNDYYFHQITEIPGYDFASDAYFEVNDFHEWNDPLVVYIPVGAAKNNIQVQINDAQTKAGLRGVTFDVIADGNVSTPDGTIRYKDGDVVTVIQCDDTGYGLSEEIYLGNYILVPTALPYGYAAPDLESRMTVLERRTEAGAYAPLMEMESEKTTVYVSVKDEYNENPVAGMTYTLTCDTDVSEAREFTTNSNGRIEITDLDKNATYTLVEKSISEGYLPSEEKVTFTVDKLGLIENSPEYSVDISYRMIRVEINTVDKVTRSGLTGYNVSIVDESGKVVEAWTSDGSSHNIEGLATGTYTLEIEDSKDKTTITVENTKDLQKFSVTVMTTRGYAIVAGIGAIIFVALAAGIIIFMNAVNKKRESDIDKKVKKADKK